MSSWLGGIGSGLGQSLGNVGGSLSSFTGQISNFTKDMLLEGVEEVGDASTELQMSNSKLADSEAAFTCQKSEHERLRTLYAELEEKLEASEIQIKSQSAEYRSLLQQKDVEISHLKARQSGLHEDFQTLQKSSQSSSVGPAMLPEINRLSNEVLRLEAEVTHWSRISQQQERGNGDQGEILKLQRTIKDLREEMRREVDEHQHELTALQDVQRQKMADITRRHKDDLAEYEERIEELEEQIHGGELLAGIL
ncbi:hypothetical protein KUCAC02_035985 [Chaenocephalus aceratus]|nr:hypothetical protein KUCAC02_035985 [Chaenocephalus aceratus]